MGRKVTLIVNLLVFLCIANVWSQKLDNNLAKQIKLKEESSVSNYLPPGTLSKKTVGYGVQNMLTTGPEQDCSGAIAVCQSSYTQANSYAGFGSVQELSSNYCIMNETNSVWYIFTIATAGNLAFQITPTATTSTDYDFALFDITNGSCADVQSGVANVVRCNFAYSSGVTGLSASGTNATESAGGLVQCSLLPVIAGQSFILIVNNYTSSAVGYTLDLASAGMTATVTDNKKPKIENAYAPCGSDSVMLKMSEAVTCTSIAADGSDFLLLGSGGAVTVTSAKTINCVGASNQVVLKLSSTLALGTSLVLKTKVGSDGNVFMDNCSNQGAVNDSIQFAIINNAASVTGNNSICPGENVILNSSIGSSYQWSTGSTNHSIAVSPTSTTTYTCTVDNGTCAASTATFTLQVKSLPAITVSPATASVCAGSSINLTASGGTSYTWVSSTTLSATSGANVTATPTATTTYYVSSAGTNGCKKTVAKTVTFNALPTVAITPSNASICSGQTVTMVAGGASTYTWSPTTALNVSNSATVISSTTAAITYTVVGTATTGCKNSATQAIAIASNPTLSVFPNIPKVCAGKAVELIANGASTYTWSPTTTLNVSNNDTVKASPTANTTYTVTGTNASGCKTTITKNVIVNPLPTIVNNINTTSICSDSVISLTVGGALTYSWFQGNGLDSSHATVVLAHPTATTVYTVAGLSNLGCVNYRLITINVTPAPVPVISIDSSISCLTNSKMLMVSGGASYQWYLDGALQSTTDMLNLIVDANKTYTVKATSVDNLCTHYATASVYVNSGTSLKQNDISNCPSIEIPLKVDSLNTSYTWSPNYNISDAAVYNPTVWPDTTTHYMCVATNPNGCKLKYSVLVKVENTGNCEIHAYNAISPNGDGQNEKWVIEGINSRLGNEVIIFNRWGRVVWRTKVYNNQTNFWEGKNTNGEQLPDGEYYYTIILKEKTIKGTIELVSQ